MADDCEEPCCMIVAALIVIALVIGFITGGVGFLVGCISNKIEYGICTSSESEAQIRARAPKNPHYFTERAKQARLDIRAPSNVEVDNGTVWLTVPIANGSDVDHSIRAEVGLAYRYTKGNERGVRHATAECSSQPGPYVIQANTTGEYAFTVCNEEVDSADGFRDFRPRITQIDGFPAVDPRDVFPKLRVEVSTFDPPIVQRSLYPDSSVLACRISVTNMDSVPHSIELDGQYSYAYTSRRGFIRDRKSLPRNSNELTQVVPSKSTIFFTNPPYESGIPQGYFVVPLEGSATDINEAAVELVLSLTDPGDENKLVAPYAKLQLPAGCSYSHASS
ncbi:hypothetical protein [Streptomyces sp. NPDC056682]|uniref:hypothetical protein n=1 Tax=Streptomyces sp. NPDC056682 TaxID=3345909 RepID=UPI0036CA56DC